MTAVLGFFFFALGAIIGSFLNVVVMRLHTGISAFQGRSMCFSCGRELIVVDLVPIISFIALAGRCRTCHAKLSRQYPIVELATALLFVAIFIGLPEPVFSFSYALQFLFLASIGSLLISIAAYDTLHKIIPNEFVYPLIVLAFVSLFITFGDPLSFTMPTKVDVLAGLLVPLPVALLFFISKGAWIGFGDAKLFTAIGWLFGVVYGFSVFVLSFWIGGAYGLLAILGKKLSLKAEVPFGPFIVLAALIILFFQIDIIGLSYFLDKKELFGVQ